MVATARLMFPNRAEANVDISLSHDSRMYWSRDCKKRPKQNPIRYPCLNDTENPSPSSSWKISECDRSLRRPHMSFNVVRKLDYT